MLTELMLPDCLFSNVFNFFLFLCQPYVGRTLSVFISSLENEIIFCQSDLEQGTEPGLEWKIIWLLWLSLPDSHTWWALAVNDKMFYRSEISL